MRGPSGVGETCSASTDADNLLQKANGLLSGDLSEEILHIEIYKNSLTEYQFTSTFLCHHFLVLKTNNWFYSLEKNDKGVYLQRSKEQRSVRKYIDGDRRFEGITRCTRIALLETMPITKSNGSLRSLINFISEEKLIGEKYHIVFSNCQRFARIIFDNVEREVVNIYFDPKIDAPLNNEKYLLTTKEYINKITTVQQHIY